MTKDQFKEALDNMNVVRSEVYGIAAMAMAMVDAIDTGRTGLYVNLFRRLVSDVRESPLYQQIREEKA